MWLCVLCFVSTMFSETSKSGEKQKLGFNYSSTKQTAVKPKKGKIVKGIYEWFIPTAMEFKWLRRRMRIP